MSHEAVGVEGVKPGFSAQELMAARERTWAAVRRVAELVRPGMAEADAERIAKDVFAEMGSAKAWHRTHVRFGRNTLKTYSEPSEPGAVLGERDIWFVDVGPVWGEYEGDAGDTFVTGDDPEMVRCAGDARLVFDQVRSRWQESRLGGAALYAFAEACARERGWELVLDVNGHRIGDFPHHLHFRGAMTEFEPRPAPGLWVLEIQLRHPTRGFGAFFEDILF